MVGCHRDKQAIYRLSNLRGLILITPIKKQYSIAVESTGSGCKKITRVQILSVRHSMCVLGQSNSILSTLMLFSINLENKYSNSTNMFEVLCEIRYHIHIYV